MGDLRKKISRRLILIKKKKSCKEITSENPAMKKISRMAYNAGKKILHR